MKTIFAAQTIAKAAPAGGAELTQIIIATAAASLLTAVLLYVGFGYRAGRIAWLRRIAGYSERVSGYPAWTAIPVAFGTGSLIVALFGMYWDIALHVDVGRDAGPLANPAHYFILGGLFGIFTAGLLAIFLAQGKPADTAIRIGPDWHAPLGGVLICACGAFSLIGFPLDDVWHRLFGQDVTLWGPTHLMLIGGAAMTLIGIAVLSVEGMRATAHTWPNGERPLPVVLRSVAATGGLMVGLSTFQAEFDFGVPQFQLIFEPAMLMLAAGVGLVAGRFYAGPGAALGAVGFFIAIRGIIALLVGPVLGETTPHLPLYIVEALVVEAVALRVSTRRPLAFGLWAGLGIGTVGLAAEWGWSHVWMPMAWPSSMLVEIAAIGLATALASSCIGAWIGSRLSLDQRVSRPNLRLAACLGAATLAAITVFGLITPSPSGVRADVGLRDVGGGDWREAQATVSLMPPDAAEGAAWFNVSSWQGGGLVVEPLKRVGEGRYRTDEPIPVGGEWKTMVRLHEGNELAALPIYMPRDDAIPAAEVPAKASFTRSFVDETQILQREKTGGSPATVVLAYGVVVGIALSLLSLLAWGLHRLSFPPRGGRRRSQSPSRSRPAPSSA